MYVKNFIRRVGGLIYYGLFYDWSKMMCFRLLSSLLTGVWCLVEWISKENNNCCEAWRWKKYDWFGELALGGLWGRWRSLEKTMDLSSHGFTWDRVKIRWEGWFKNNRSIPPIVYAASLFFLVSISMQEY